MDFLDTGSILVCVLDFQQEIKQSPSPQGLFITYQP
jgi:hypothetical protein